MKTGHALKMGAAALALSLMAGNAWAAASCARPQDMRALQTAALQQQLMVAALTCHDTADYNRFVTSYRCELLESDLALIDFFLRQDAHKGADGYNAYKTRLANVLSLRSLHDPQFCRSAKVAFDVALNRKGSLAELASERPSLIQTGYTSCVPSVSETTQMADAAPRYVPRYSDAAPQQPRAYDRGNDDYDDDASDNSDNRGGADNGPIENDDRSAYRYAYNAPHAYVPYAYRPHAYWVHSYGPPARPRLVRGPYGRWYLLPPYGR